MSESDTFVAASSNSVYDAVVPKFATSELIIVRAHSLSLERDTLLKPYFKVRREGKLATADPLSEDCKRSESTQAVSKQRIVEVQRPESISGADSSDQNDDEEGHVTDQIAEGEAVDDRSPENFYHANRLALFFESYTGRVCVSVLLAGPPNKSFRCSRLSSASGKLTRQFLISTTS